MPLAQVWYGAVAGHRIRAAGGLSGRPAWKQQRWVKFAWQPGSAIRHMAENRCTICTDWRVGRPCPQSPERMARIASNARIASKKCVMSNQSRSRHRFAVVVLSVCRLIVFAAPSRAQDPALALEETVVKLVERIEPSVVSIARVKPAPSDAGYVPLDPLDRRKREPGLIERQRREQELPPTDPEDPDFQPNDFGAGTPGPVEGRADRARLARWWLLVPVSFFVLGLLVVGIVVGRNWLRYRRMRAAVRAEHADDEHRV